MKSFFNKIREFIKSNKTARYILCFMALLAVFSLSVALFSREEKQNNLGNSSTEVSGDTNTSESTDNGNNTEDNSSDNVDFSKLTYAAFGDSITYGADYTRGYAQMDFPYPQSVADVLNLKSCVNYGISGSTLCSNTLGLVNMTNTVMSVTSSYDIISVMGGVNDFNRELPLGSVSDTENSTVYGSLDMIARHLKKYNPKSFIFFMTPYKEDFGGYSYLEKNQSGYMLSDVVEAVKTVAARYDIPVLDMYNLGGFEDVMYNSDCDGIHPNQDFILEQTTPQIVEFIKENYKK